MLKSIRQSTATLHSWLGLIFGWLLFLIFVMGSLSLYKTEINYWMQPQFATMQTSSNEAAQSAFAYLQTHAPDAKSWFIHVAHDNAPVNRVFWQTAEGAFENRILNASTGSELQLLNTQGGDFFYRLHFQLYGMSYMTGQIIVTFTAFILLILLISGVITHKKLLIEFFTLRTNKGQLSYLDYHTVSAVTAMPFFFVTAFTGLAMFFYVLFPANLKLSYPDNPFQYFEEIRTIPQQDLLSTPEKAEMRPIQYFLKHTTRQWGVAPLDTITVKSPNTSSAHITINKKEDRTITRNQDQFIFNAHTGELLKNNRNTSALATLNNGIYGLHMARYAQPSLRFILFLSGILGATMIASGLFLWSLKRQIKNKKQSFHLGAYLVNRLNMTATIGLGIAVLSYFYINRLVTAPYNLPNYEITTFFSVWFICFLIACLMPQHQLWKSLLKGFIILALILPIINLCYLFNHHLISSFSSYWMFLRVDLLILLFALLAIFLHQKIAPIASNQVTQNQFINGIR
ncbi:PepSY-associated TM helix domain-containing protein [Acinetobacter thermotolerans]|uniref:PepSY-associated TM helix domain-containing protein n=1 Tax=Acinetobacter TaxID=469 RepID=UPI000948D5E0|nr:MULTISPECIES: PepSY-associated TM helix domain-containing protein [Acinetobacter]MCO8089665.1 PepSY domain-containing protein [Acinetobacter indicus]MCU4451201.1 PepSY domain-containing protein [Acinetobacter lwoffii]